MAVTQVGEVGDDDVAEGAHRLELGLTDGTSVAADVVGIDHATDRAVVRASSSMTHRPASFGTSACASGNPQDLEVTPAEAPA